MTILCSAIYINVCIKMIINYDRGLVTCVLKYILKQHPSNVMNFGCDPMAYKNGRVICA